MVANSSARKGYVRPIHHLVDVERVQPGEGGERPDEPASPDIDPGHAAQFARLRQVEAAQESGKRSWPLCSLDAGLASVGLDSGRLRLECDTSLYPGRWARSRDARRSHRRHQGHVEPDGRDGHEPVHPDRDEKVARHTAARRGRTQVEASRRHSPGRLCRPPSSSASSRSRRIDSNILLSRRDT